MSINDNVKLLENTKQGFKRTISWNKYRSKITIRSVNDNSDSRVDPTFRNSNRLFVLSFKTGNNDITRSSFDKYYMPLVEIKDFNALIKSKPLFDEPVKKNKKRMKNLLKCQETMTMQ